MRKFVLGIQAQANSKNLTRPFMPAAPRPSLRTLRNHLFAALHNFLTDSTPT
ncbi:hypothetical protein [Candidatus Reidiella endopervernicosa]|uniref:Uncharacterized protein n=1 Tax=Candidatus Reidiella endopervernicosa TaxID=2738883 RepID=A0A6N0HW82_9GAMM|nr:hypothetical protein [Candidatus Reidiella endopervernicosa]QKQ26436.1 hypothetical protein HUE57_09210 [Candidatus Reidiella endopervernicosa]